MSFSSKVKNEICRYHELQEEEAIALLSAIMRSSGTLTFGKNKGMGFKITTENAAITRLVFKTLKNVLDIHTRIMIKKSSSFKKNNVYMILITKEKDVKKLLEKTEVVKMEEVGFFINYNISENLVYNDSTKKAYIRGAFLGGGSVSNPEKTYHLEFVTNNEGYANKLSDLINTYNLNSKVIQRKNNFIIYIKEGEQISDILNIIGAHSSLLQLENIRIMKDLRNNINRIVNCETANLSKTVNAAVRQIGSINLINKEIGLKRLPKNLRDMAEVRLKHPDVSLKELGEMLNPPVGKSGVNHRLRRIEKIADELSKEGKF